MFLSFNTFMLELSIVYKKKLYLSSQYCFNMLFTGTYEITESFLYPVGQLVVDPRIYILIQKEV